MKARYMRQIFLIGILYPLVLMPVYAEDNSSQASKKLTPEQIQDLDDAFKQLESDVKKFSEGLPSPAQLENLQAQARQAQIDIARLAGAHSFRQNRCHDYSWKQEVRTIRRELNNEATDLFDQGFRAGWHEAARSNDNQPCHSVR